ncbi:MAG: TRAP transporter small permease [Calditrichaeota bacterium]|nr:TRAP transporter small permease [Calditrichota bacterium]
MTAILQVVRRAIRQVAAFAVTVLTGWLLFNGLLLLIARWLGWQSPLWAEAQIKFAVLWIGLTGGILAAADDRHIRIDLVDHYLSQTTRRRLKQVMHLTSAIGTGIIALLSRDFLIAERSAGSISANFLFGTGVPLYYLELIIPIAFGLMATLFTLAFLLPGSSPSRQ